MSQATRIRLCSIILGFLLLGAPAMTDHAGATANCYIVQVQIVNILDRAPDGTPLTWYVYFYLPGSNRLSRSMTFWPAYASGDWLRICDGKLPWGEWQRTYLPVVSRS
jgi:hypothetical protein